MLRWLADENFNNDIVRAIRRKKPDLDLVRAQDAGLNGVSDAVLLDWAAAENRIVLTHDVATLTYAAYDRVRQGLAMPGSLKCGARFRLELSCKTSSCSPSAVSRENGKGRCVTFR